MMEAVLSDTFLLLDLSSVMAEKSLSSLELGVGDRAALSLGLDNGFTLDGVVVEEEDGELLKRLETLDLAGSSALHEEDCVNDR
jgi:hypothetical protein